MKKNEAQEMCASLVNQQAELVKDLNEIEVSAEKVGTINSLVEMRKKQVKQKLYSLSLEL